MILLLLACGPKIDPLHPLQESLQKAREAGPTAAPHLRFAVSERAIGDMLVNAVNPERPFVMPVMLGTVAAIRIELERPTLATAYDDACSCAVASLDAHGLLNVDVAGLLGKQVLAKDLGFSAHVDGAPSIRVVPEADGLSLRLEAHPGHPWAVDLELDEEKGFLTNKLVDNQFEGPVAGFLDQSIQVARLSPDIPLKPTRIELVAAPGAALDVWLDAEPSQAPPELQVDEGWGLAMSESGMLAVMRAAIAGQEQHPRWKIEPLAIQVRNRAFTSKIRVHRVARKVQWRDYDVRGIVAESPEGFTIQPAEVTEIAKHGWGGSLVGGFVTPTVRKQILKRQISLPRSFETDDERYPTRWEVKQVEANEDGLFVHGTLELLPPGPPPADEGGEEPAEEEG